MLIFSTEYINDERNYVSFYTKTRKPDWHTIGVGIPFVSRQTVHECCHSKHFSHDMQAQIIKELNDMQIMISMLVLI
jgi:hypothetical protein